MTKPTKEQIKTVFKKILNYHRLQREANENNVSVKDNAGNEETQKDKSKFDNEQMLLHFYDISEGIELKFSKESNSIEEDLKINFRNQLISIEPSLTEFAFTYEELNKTFRLEAKTLIEELIIRMGDEYSLITETLVVDFLKEILKEKKLQIEKEAFKRKIVWLKK